MIHTIKKAITVFSLVVFGSVVLYNCEPDADTLGEQLFLNGAAQGEEKSFDVRAFNIINNDTIRTDASKLGYAVLGAFDESQFGMQKASYLTQFRLPAYAPDFGTNATVDSVVLVIKPTYALDSIKTTTLDDGYTYTTATENNVNAKKVVNTYPVYKFGKAKKTFNIQVHEVTTFLKGASDSAKSNQVYEYDLNNVLGSKEFKGDISSVTITKDDGGATLFPTTSTTATPGIRIPLNKTFFQDKIIAKKGQPELADASNFIRHIKGLRISVQENDGYLFQFSPNDMELIMYYKYDTTDNGTPTRTQATYSFAMGSANAHIGSYVYDRSNSVLNHPSTIKGNRATGDPKLFIQGMGGPSIGVRIPTETITELKQIYDHNKAAIISAKIRIYTDKDNWNNNYAKPSAFTFLQKYKKKNSIVTVTNFTDDAFSLAGSNDYRMVKYYDLDKNPAYYEFTVTQSVKNLIEKVDDGSNEVDNSTKYFRIDMGSFLSNSDGTGLAGFKSISTPFNTIRAVLVGSDALNAKQVKLNIIYGTKK